MYAKQTIEKIKSGLRKNNYYILRNDGRFKENEIRKSLNLIKKFCTYNFNSKKKYLQIIILIKLITTRNFF